MMYQHGKRGSECDLGFEAGEEEVWLEHKILLILYVYVTLC